MQSGESKRLTQLVQEIIDLSRVQDHTAPSATEKISAAEVVDDAADRARTRAEGKNIHIEVSPPGRMLIEGNYELLVNAVRNLIDEVRHQLLTRRDPHRSRGRTRRRTR